VDGHRDETAKGFKDVDKRFDRMDERLDELDEDLTGHMKVHRKVEEDIAYLKGRPARSAARAPRRRVGK
jgi:hypothetical protein